MGSFSIPSDWLEITRHMTNEEAGEFWRSVMEYAIDGKEPEVRHGTPLALFPLVKNHIDSQVSKWSRPKSKSKRMPIGNKKRFMVLERDGFRCVYCGRSADEAVLEIDHVLPVSKGGGNEPENLVTSCKECNRGKRDHVIGEDREWS